MVQGIEDVPQEGGPEPPSDSEADGTSLAFAMVSIISYAAARTFAAFPLGAARGSGCRRPGATVPRGGT